MISSDVGQKGQKVRKIGTYHRTQEHERSSVEVRKKLTYQNDETGHCSDIKIAFDTPSAPF